MSYEHLISISGKRAKFGGYEFDTEAKTADEIDIKKLVGSEEYKDWWKQKLFGTTSGVTYFESEEAFKSQLKIEAKLKGLSWMKGKLEGSAAKTVDEYAEKFSTDGNGLEIYSKVYTLPDGAIMARK